MQRQNLPYKQAIGALQSIHIPGPFGLYDNGSVILSDYKSFVGTHSHSFFKFSTLETPFDHEHPVAGNREFGIYNSTANPSEFTFYTMGVDRIWDWASQFANDNISDGFKQADSLWKNVQDNLKMFIIQNGGNATYYIPRNPHARPNWDAVKEFLLGNMTEAQLKIALGC